MNIATAAEHRWLSGKPDHCVKDAEQMTNRGGKREGAGRKPRPGERKVPLALKLAVELSEYLATCENKTATIEDALRRSKGFREWRKNVAG